MIAEFTYDSLFAALQAWPRDSDDDYLTNLPTIIDLGQLRLVRDLNLEAFDREDTTQSTVIGTREVAIAEDCVTLRDVGIIVAGSYVGLEKRSRQYCRMYAPTTTQARPVYWYESTEEEIGMVPNPDAVYVVVQHCNKRPSDSLSLSAQGPSWLSARAPDALFAACLAEAEQYLKADDRYADYIGKYNNELLPVARLELRAKIRSGDYAPIRGAAQTLS